MADSKKLVWDAVGKHKFETGVSKGVLYPESATVVGTYDKGVPWNGLTTVTESPSGAELTTLYADGIEYLNLLSAEKWEGTIEAYTYPDEFCACDGSASIVPGVVVHQQTRKRFAFSYQTVVGNDSNPSAGYKIHIIYECMAQPAERAHATVNDTPEAMTMSWSVKATPVDITGFKPSASIELDSTVIAADKMAAIEDKLYGNDTVDAAVLLPNEIATLVGAAG